MTAIIADIGGTNSRFALTEGDGNMVGVRTYLNSEFGSLDEVVSAYIEDCGVRPKLAAIAVAGPVKQQQVMLTNLGWQFSAASLQKQHAIAKVELLNDFAAMAWAALFIDPETHVQLGGGSCDPAAARVVIGPGTGLGVGALVPAGQGWTVVAGEGGHVTLPVLTEAEASLAAAATQVFGHCSAERVLSGRGLQFIYQHLGGGECDPSDITAAAVVGEQPAEAALQMFFEMLGTVTGDLALTFGAQGGVYLTGGILPTLVEPLRASAFRQRFEYKGRLAGYLREIPVYLIVAPNPALEGLAGYMSLTG